MTSLTRVTIGIPILSGDLVVFGTPNRDSYESLKKSKNNYVIRTGDFFHQLAQIGAGFPKHPLYGTLGFKI